MYPNNVRGKYRMNRTYYSRRCLGGDRVVYLLCANRARTQAGLVRASRGGSKRKEAVRRWDSRNRREQDLVRERNIVFNNFSRVAITCAFNVPRARRRYENAHVPSPPQRDDYTYIVRVYPTATGDDDILLRSRVFDCC